MIGRVRGALAAVAALLAAGVVATGAVADDTPPPNPPPPPGPKLVVMISIDQLSANLFNEYRSRFRAGFRTFLDEGLVYANGFQTHAFTETCPGHATLLTGVHPARAGIPSNSWLDTTTGQRVYCFAAPGWARADDPKAPPVGPGNLRAETLGDWLKAASPKSRVVTVAGKDRSALALGGHRADGSFWFAENFGFTTYVAPGEDAQARLAPVAALNAELMRRKAEKVTWTYSEPRCRALEQTWDIAGKPYRSALPKDPIPALGMHTIGTPFLDEMTLEAAAALVDRYRLGRGEAVDLLGVSLSSTDGIGHTYGPEGAEMCDHLARIDRALGVFLDRLKQVDPNVLVVLSADHGGSDFTERLQARGFPEAARSDGGLVRDLNAALKAEFQLSADPLAGGFNQISIVDAERKALKEPLRSRVMTSALARIRARPEVVAAYLTEDLLKAPAAKDVLPDELSLRDRMAMSAVRGRSGDIMVSFRPYLSFGGNLSSHGSPWDYDRRVPILFWRPGGQPQERFPAIETVDIAPTLAHAIGLKAPADLDGRCLDLGLGGPCPR